jgi:hypothetical protein
MNRHLAVSRTRKNVSPRWVVSMCAIVLVALLPSTAAQAQTPNTVTLKASDRHLRYGDTTTLSGRISPPQPGQRVTIIDQRGRTRARTRTDAQGRYSLKLSPNANAKLRARWVAAISDPVKVKVRPILNVHLRKVRLFGRASIPGALQPAHPGSSVKLTIFREGKKVGTRQAKLRRGRWFTGHFRVRRTGDYRVRATFDDPDHVFVGDHTTRRSPFLPNLSSGSSGPYVKLLERRLRQLQYHVPDPDRQFDYRTSDAVVAFNKVQGRSRVGSVNASTWTALASPFRPRPDARTPRLHIEVDQTRQVLYVVRNGRIDDTIHVSTGAGGATYDGVFHVYRKIAGYSPHRLYYPSYYSGARAIHGWPEVPTYPASHGCVRVPYWTAKWIFRIADIGREVRIYH